MLVSTHRARDAVIVRWRWCCSCRRSLVRHARPGQHSQSRPWLRYALSGHSTPLPHAVSSSRTHTCMCASSRSWLQTRDCTIDVCAWMFARTCGRDKRMAGAISCADLIAFSPVSLEDGGRRGMGRGMDVLQCLMPAPVVGRWRCSKMWPLTSKALKVTILHVCHCCMQRVCMDCSELPALR